MSRAIEAALRIKEEQELKAACKYEQFKSDALEKLSYCLLNDGDLHEIIETLCENYWDLFQDDLPNSDINLLVTEAVSCNIRNEK